MPPTPKKVRINTSIGPSTQKDTRIAMSDVSIGIESGWRGVDGCRVEELVTAFLNGEYGNNLLRKPMILMKDSQPVTCEDGRQRLVDGKSTFAALAKVHEMFVDAEKCEAYEWSQELITAMDTRVDVIAAEFTDDSADMLMAYCVGVHDIESNKYKATSLNNLVEVAERFRAHTPGALGTKHNNG